MCIHNSVYIYIYICVYMMYVYIYIYSLGGHICGGSNPRKGTQGKLKRNQK